MYTSTRAKDSLVRIIKLKPQVVHARSSCGRWGPTGNLSLLDIVSAITTFSTLDSKDGRFLWSVRHPWWLSAAWGSTWGCSFCGAVFRFHTRVWGPAVWLSEEGGACNLRVALTGWFNITYTVAYELCSFYIQHPYITDIRLVLPHCIRWESWDVAMRPSRYWIRIQ